MQRAARIQVRSRDGARLIKTQGVRGGKHAARRVEASDRAVRRAHVAVGHAVRVDVVSRYGTGRIDGCGIGALVGVGTRSPGIEDRKMPARKAEEGVKHVGPIENPSHDNASVRDAVWDSALAGVRAGARRIEGCNPAVKGAHEAVTHTVRVDIRSDG